jgi:hypothetical protein
MTSPRDGASIMNDSATGRLTSLERCTLWLLLGAVVAFGVLVELRSAFLMRRMGDLGCYLRPAWAITTGVSIYDVTDDNHWHYNYPPLYAILMVPFADAPPGQQPTGLFPFAVSAALIYLLNIGCLLLAVHLLASALERNAADRAIRTQPRFCRRWWALRTGAMLVCLAPAGHSAMRGQVNLQILALLCGWFACQLAGRRFVGGCFLAVAICIKVIPLYLLSFPVWRRDGRTLAGCAAGLLLGLVAVPLAVLGPSRTISEYRHYGDVFFGPLLGVSEDTSREKEILGMNATDSMGVKHALHNWIYRDESTRPHSYQPAEEWAHRILGVAMTLLVLLPGSRVPLAGSARAVQQWGALLGLMVIFSPISHVHYFVYCLPLVMGLLLAQWEHRTTLRLNAWLLMAFVWFAAATALPAVPGLDICRDLCLPLFGALPLLALAIFRLWRGANSPSAASGDTARLAA